MAEARAEIASQINFTPEHFSRIPLELAQAGLLQMQGWRITVAERQRLQAASQRR